MAVPAHARPDVAAALDRMLAAPPPFYSGLAGAGVHSLATLPLTFRRDVLRDQLEHLPFGTRRLAGAAPLVRLGISGTGDDLLVLAWSAADLAWERAAGCRLLGRLGVAAGMRVANTLPGALATPGSLLLGDVIEDLGGLDVPLGTVDGDAAAREAWDLIDRVEPAVTVLDEGSAARLAAARPGGRRGWWRGIVWLRRAGEAAPRVRMADFAGWERVWLAVPEATSFVAGTCRASRFHADQGILAEIVDEATGTPRRPGEEGSLVVTALVGDTALVRYVTGARARLAPPPCPCGEPGVAFEVV